MRDIHARGGGIHPLERGSHGRIMIDGVLNRLVECEDLRCGLRLRRYHAECREHTDHKDNGKNGSHAGH